MFLKPVCQNFTYLGNYLDVSHTHTTGEEGIFLNIVFIITIVFYNVKYNVGHIFSIHLT